MQVVELTAKSLKDATSAAATKLGVSADQITVTVLEESKGLFGKTTVRVRAEVIAAPAPAPEKAAPAAEKKEKPAKKATKAEPAAAVEEPAAPAVEVAAPAVPKKLGRKLGTPAAAEPVAAVAPAVEESAPVAPRGRGGRGPKPAAPVSEDSSEAPEVEAGASDVQATQADGEALLSLVEMLLAATGLEVDVKVTGLQNRYVNIQLDGKDAAFLVGKHGEVLNALQYMANIVAGRKLQNGVRATIDANDYRKRREDALTTLANKIADQVVERGEEAVLDALPAFERRIVHKALSVHGGITTYSEGEEPNRRVVIAPAE